MPKIPKFKNEEEEREFWATHDAAEYTADDERIVDMEFVNQLPDKRRRDLAGRIGKAISSHLEDQGVTEEDILTDLQDFKKRCR